MNTTKNYSTDGGDKAVVGGALEVESGGSLAVKSGGTLEVQSGGTLEIKTGANVNGLPAGPAGADAVWLSISRPCILIPCNASGVAIAGSAAIVIHGYIGAAEKLLVVDADIDNAGLTKSNVQNEGENHVTVTVSWEAVTLSAASGLLTLIIGVTGYNADSPANAFIRTIPWCKVTASGAT